MEKRNLFIIGDSISIHYDPYLKKMIKGKFNYDRKKGIEQPLEDLDRPVGANAGDSEMILQYLTEEYHKNTKYDILVINCGLHDIRVNRSLNKIQVSLEEYKMNLIRIIEISKSMANKIIWVGLTPVIDEIHNSRKAGFLRYNEDVITYDTAAKEIMRRHEILCIEMYDFTKTLGDDIYSDHVHFKDEIRKLQAAFIAGYLNCI